MRAVLIRKTEHHHRILHIRSIKFQIKWQILFFHEPYLSKIGYFRSKTEKQTRPLNFEISLGTNFHLKPSILSFST